MAAENEASLAGVGGGDLAVEEYLTVSEILKEVRWSEGLSLVGDHRGGQLEGLNQKTERRTYSCENAQITVQP